MECVAFVVLFWTALFFNNVQRNADVNANANEELTKFISQKKQLALLLLTVYVVVACYSLSTWSYALLQGDGSTNRMIFFLDFFTILIMADILILLLSYQYITDFSHLARNTGFVLSTVILRVAIASPGISGAILFTLAGCLGSSVLLSGIIFGKKASSNFSESE